MKFHHPPANMDIGDALLKTLEMELQKSIDGIRIYDDKKDFFKVIIFFNDKSIMDAKISMIPAGDKWGCRIQGKYL
jgi:hypothetical protein